MTELYGRTAMSNNALTHSPISPDGRRKIGDLLRILLADFFTLYIKTKNFTTGIWGGHTFAITTSCLTSRRKNYSKQPTQSRKKQRKIGETTLRSIGDIARYQRLTDADASENDAVTMLLVLCKDNNALATFMREAHEVCDATGDLATASLLENWIDEAERRSWFLSATVNAG